MPQLQFLKKRIDEKKYSDLRRALREARIARPLRDYVASSMFYSVAILLALAPTFYFLFWFLLGFPPIYAAPLSIGASGGMSYGCYRLLLYYPRLQAKNRQKEIDDILPHAVAFMLAMSKGGYEPIRIFESLSEYEENYGAISKEAATICRNVKLLGYSPTEAIQEVADTTPSEKLRDFLNSLATVVETGSGISRFLSEQCERFYSSAEQKQKEDLETLAVFSEIYVVVLGLGPLLVMILVILLGMMGNLQLSLLYAVIYILVPIGTILFIVLLDMLAKTEIKGGKFEELESEGREEDVKKLLGKPPRRKYHGSFLQRLLDEPARVLPISVAAAIVAVILVADLSIKGITTGAVMGLLVSLSPFAILQEIKARRTERMDEATPDFLSSFGGAVRSGLSPAKAIKSLPSGRFGGLGPELDRMKKDLEWGSSISEALRKSARRAYSSLVRRVMLLVGESTTLTSKLDEILEVLSRDVSIERRLKEERHRTTFSYVIIIYISFGVFLITAVSIATSFTPLLTMAQQAAPAEEAAQAVPGIGVTGVSPETIELAFFHAALVQGFSSGFIAGKLEKGKILPGLKHSLIMLSAAWAIFMLLVL